MKVYVDFEKLDVEDKPTYICNKYNLQVKSINSGSIYENVELVSLTDYTKQVRKEVCEQIQKIAKQISKPNTEDNIIFNYTTDAQILDNILRWLKNGEQDIVDKFLSELDQIQGDGNNA